ncbi:response regulator [Caballeronia telluris]|jgi:CheY-like chemotaxis protein|uniref:Response regulator receiver protein n=1 Tax=Caballeronia telluris TaxID=326475 RepID=A0A158EXS6_9BURK|nr:response regulator [Caballeronia telluris]SAL12361.1 response regulator receiver protein [Caballeronia telluris]
MEPYERTPRETIWRIPQAASPIEEKRVLIADDDLSATRATMLALEDAGFVVRAAHTGLDAVGVARKWRPATVLLDLTMPLGDGWEAAEVIRASDPGMLLMAHTSSTDYADWQRSRRSGFDAYFVKPTEPARIIEVIEQYFLQQPASGA